MKRWFEMLMPLLVLFWVPPPVVAQYTAGGANLQIPPDVRAEGMGRVWAPLATSPYAAWGNVGGLGLLEGVQFAKMHAQLVPDLASDVYFDYTSIVAGYSPISDPLPLNFSIGFNQTDLDYGLSVWTDPGSPDPIGTFRSAEKTNGLTPNPLSVAGSTSGHVSLRAVGALAWSNRGGEISLVPDRQSDPLPAVRREAIGLELNVLPLSSLATFQSPVLKRLTRDAHVLTVSGGLGLDDSLVEEDIPDSIAARTTRARPGKPAKLPPGSSPFRQGPRQRTAEGGSVAEVRFENVSKEFPGGVKAVQDVSLRVRNKELMVLVGPSGCGKSTMLRLVAGLEEATAGRLYIGDRPVNGVPPKDRDIAMVFQSYALYPHMTVRENMGFGLKLRRFKLEEIGGRVDRTADLLGLTPFLDRRPGALSGGQRQRVALGRAIVRQPLVFLFDEPLSNLDASLRVQTRTEISKLHRELDATMIYVTHDQVEAMTMADRIAVMKDGILQQVAEPLALYNEPRNRFVASFIGSPSMNFIEGTVEGGFFRAPGFAVPMAGRLERTRARPGQATLGIRPEDIDLVGEESSPAPAPPGEDGSVAASAQAVEPLGNEVFLHAEVAGTPLLARIGPGFLPRVGAGYRLKVDTGRAHLFDPHSGESLIPLSSA